MDAATLWRTRAIWALVGAGVTLAITNLRERGGGNAERSAVAGDEAGDEASDEASDEVGDEVSDEVGDEVGDVAPTIAPIAEPSTVVTTAKPLPVADEPIASATTSPPPAPAAGPPVVPFEIPLPTMPGARVMKRTHSPAPEHGGTIHTLSLSVPAPGMQVEQFYRSALVDAKLVVSGGHGEPTSIGSSHRSSLRGRRRDATVHVNLQQRAGKLRTIVRIIWRVLP